MYTVGQGEQATTGNRSLCEGLVQYIKSLLCLQPWSQRATGQVETGRAEAHQNTTSSPAQIYTAVIKLPVSYGHSPLPILGHSGISPNA